jgi:hypothetical protein
MTPRAALVLRGEAAPRALELTLDSLLGQTEQRFVLDAGGAGAAGRALLRRYGDARFLTAPAPACEFAGVIEAGSVLAPTWLARLAAALDAAPDAAAARAGATLFDGVALRPAAAPAGVAGALLRRATLPPGWADATDPAAFGRVVTLPGRLVIRREAPHAAPPVQRRLATALYGHAYLPADIEAERPPTLHVVVDTEAEFDWDKPFAENLTGVSALSQVESAQAIFDRYGLRPTYVIDYPVASQADSVAAIRAIADRGGCAVGAHLHPWTNPPFGAAIDQAMSFPGNLPPDMEAAKLDALLSQIGAQFGERPLFYKAGRYGLGPNTARLIAARGVAVDFSLMPETDMRDVHGPDFRMVAAIPYTVDALNLLAVPMTRADLGPLSRWWRLRGWLDTQTATLLHVRGMLVRAGLLERLTLTPEGVSAKLQIVLLNTLLRRGHRLFVLHFHSPSLVAGHTPYVRNEAERAAFLARIEAVCRWFFEELGGVPGRPWDLLPVEQRSRAGLGGEGPGADPGRR